MSAGNTFTALNIAVLTVSDTRTADNDTSGDLLQNKLQEAGHHCSERALVKDDVYAMRREVSRWIADDTTHVVLITGGTGFSGRDSTPEAILPLLDKEIIGFGELFRQVSYEQVGSSTIQSRCLGGLANNTLVFCLPGSNNACATGWDVILKEQLDATHKPCNFVALLTKGNASA
ncbi:molybdenum cofactor biosynthesis protein B [Marinibactrum halimedae]|uniref:Molybdenum cofactor biosynthesis protein B n=1 Tax=Marinibactrum halimedae TaxID=1444977 RepID=A0AA37WLE4_9GAMM|nr:molybdenum cofactor biosynthesis protein B [Marinibactrum halimedae]MCD9458665.1 molybdenum cofactor biosynthesis protein B [Marinibactrum halimedae]GLS25969.1 molybdenum cofactor biosynthesis protein B [Marinibactrum halimedae]